MMPRSALPRWRSSIEPAARDEGAGRGVVRRHPRSRARLSLDTEARQRRLPRAARALLLAALLAPATGLASPFEAEHPKVREGNGAFERGDYQAALEAYEQAARELGERPELHYNRGNALLKLGRGEDARRAFESALSNANRSLKARDYHNLGNALVGLGQQDEAMAAYRQALKTDPSFEPSRHNLEVLLRRKSPQPPQPQQADGGASDGGADGGSDGGRGPGDGGEDAGADGGSDAGGSDGGSDGGSGDGGSDGGGDGGRDGGTDGGSGSNSGDGGSADASGDAGSDGGSSASADGGAADGGASMSERPPEPATPEPMDRQRAEQLLEALRRQEKQFLMQQHREKVKKRAQPEKDW